MNRRGIGHGSCLTVAIACALAACSSNGNGGMDDQGKKGVSMQHARNDAGSAKDAGGDAATDGGTTVGGGGGPGKPALKAPPDKYDCTFGSNGGHGYWFCAAKLKREPGRSVCRQLGADFIVIDDAAENAFIADQISEDTYIGFSDADKEGTWVWVDGSKGTYTNWDTKQPGDADFALIEKSNGKWKTTVDLPLAFACEGPKLMKP